MKKLSIFTFAIALSFSLGFFWGNSRNPVVDPGGKADPAKLADTSVGADKSNPQIESVPQTEPTRAANTKIEFEETSFDFGEVPQNIPVRHTFKFYNKGEKDLILEDVKPSCSCTLPTWTRDAVKPGGSGIITAEFNAKSTGIFKKSVTVISNGSETPVILDLKGEVAVGSEKPGK